MSHRFSFCVGKSDGGNYDNDNCSNNDYDDPYDQNRREKVKYWEPGSHETQKTSRRIGTRWAFDIFGWRKTQKKDDILF